MADDNIDMNKAEFYGTIPGYRSALQIGEDDSRVHINIPGAQLHEALKLSRLRKRPMLKFTVELIEDEKQAYIEMQSSFEDPYEDLYKEQSKPKRVIEIK